MNIDSYFFLIPTFFPLFEIKGIKPEVPLDAEINSAHEAGLACHDKGVVQLSVLNAPDVKSGFSKQSFTNKTK